MPRTFNSVFATFRCLKLCISVKAVFISNDFSNAHLIHKMFLGEFWGDSLEKIYITLHVNYFNFYLKNVISEVIVHVQTREF